jgi:putative glycerol-1-phosphate prenyltransferase
MSTLIFNKIDTRKKQQKKSFAVLIDPDKTGTDQVEELVSLCRDAEVDLIFVGGSLVVSEHMETLVQHIKRESDIPVILFPGSPSQVTPYADALLYLSLISGRNPELLIGQHVISAPQVRKSGLEIMSTGYMVIDGGAPTTVSYISNASPIPADKNEIAVCTAMAGEMLGMKLIYMDAGSGAKNPVNESMIQSVSKQISIPLIVGGGIRDAERAYRTAKAGADVVVVGNAIEKNPSLISEIGKAIHSVSELVLKDF